MSRSRQLIRHGLTTFVIALFGLSLGSVRTICGDQMVGPWGGHTQSDAVAASSVPVDPQGKFAFGVRLQGTPAPPPDRLAYRPERPRYTRLGHPIRDPNLSVPRTWIIRDLWFHDTITTIVEQDKLKLDNYFYRPVWSYAGDIYQDHWYFYSAKSLLCLGAGVGVGAVLANTTLDQEFQDWFQDNAVGAENAWDAAKLLGEALFWLPVLGITWAIDDLTPNYGWFYDHLWSREFGAWSRESLRGFVVGAPVVGLLQILTGASRPGETVHGSKWKPFDDNNGVSGHAFIGAVPFLAAAKRTDNFFLKSAFFVGSGLAGYSRLYDNAHYLSQVLLGWWIAFLSVEATHLTERSTVQYRLVPLTIDGLLGVGVEMRR